MTNRANNSYNVNIGGDVSGKVAIGSHITQGGEVSAGGAEGLRAVLPAQQEEVARLRDFLSDHFNVDELRDLAFDLGVDYEDLAGTGKRAKVRELALYFYRQNRLEELVQAAKERRPLVG